MTPDAGDEIIAVAMQMDILVVTTKHAFDDGKPWDRAHEALKAVGFISEGGSARVMDEADIIAGSPLDAALKKARNA